MSVELWNYEAALLEMERFREHNSLVLDTWELMQGRLREVEEALKDFARQNGPEESESFIVTVQAKFRRWLDADIVVEMAPYVKDIPGVMVWSVDKDKITALAKGGMLPNNVTEAAYREERLTPAVSIKAKALASVTGPRD